MQNTKDQEIAKLDRKIKLAGITDLPGFIMLAVGLYTKFGADGQALHPLLDNESVVNGLIIIGALIMVGTAIRLVGMINRRNKLRAEDQI